jgi:hypothetical protein
MKKIIWALVLHNQQTKRNTMAEQTVLSLEGKAINKWTKSTLVIESSSPEGQQEGRQNAKG